MKEIPSGIAVWIPDQNIEESIDMALKMWGAEQPDEVRAYKIHMDKRRSELHNEKGMSTDGTMRAVAEIPPRLHRVFSRMFGDDYVRDKKFHAALYRCAPGFFTGGHRI